MSLVSNDDDARVERPHDRLVRLIFAEDLESARGELMVMLPPGVVAAIDWSSLALADPALLDTKLAERTADFLYEVKLAGRDALLYVLLEHQSASDELFVLRALVYVARVWDRWLRKNAGAARVPPVIPVLLTHASGGWRAPTKLTDVIDFGSEALRAQLAPLVPSLELRLVDDLSTVDDEMLDARAMPARGKLTLAALRDVRDAPDLTAALRSLAVRTQQLSPTDPMDLAARAALVSYIPGARRRDDEQTITQAVRAAWPSEEEDLLATIQELMDMHRAEGLERGKAEAERALVSRVLSRRFGPLNPALIERIAAADAATLARWAEQVLDVSSPDDLR